MTVSCETQLAPITFAPRQELQAQRADWASIYQPTHPSRASLISQYLPGSNVTSHYLTVAPITSRYLTLTPIDQRYPILLHFCVLCISYTLKAERINMF